LLGPEGIAVFYSSHRGREQLTLRQQGWHMFADPWNFDRDDWTPAASARRFEAGSPNSAGQAALHASIGLLLEQGPESLAARILDNTDYLINRLPGAPGVHVTSRSEPERCSGIVSFVSDRLPSREIYLRLRELDCSCAVRDGAVRLSPHFYQDESVLESFMELLGQVLSQP
jgi:selenocysteine lyase/cysteine desulfurase